VRSDRVDVAGGMSLNRRQLLTGAAVCGSGLLTTPRALHPTVARAAAAVAAGSDLGAIEHVVFLMQENRSFDHYFGAYRGVRGFNDHATTALGAFAQPLPANTSRQPVGVQLPFHLNSGTGFGECTHDINHSWLVQHESRSDGTNDAFASSHTSSQFDGPDRGLLTMGYYTRADLPYHYALADNFTICDAYFSSILGPTHPNRLMSMSGTVDSAGKYGGPVLSTELPKDALFSVSWTTVPELLESAGVSWKTYTTPGQGFIPDSANLGFGNAILPYFSQFSKASTTLHQKAFLPTFPGDFASDVSSGRLPKVSWIISPEGFDEHPPTPPSFGARFIDQVLRTLLSNSAVWSKTVVFITYDENGGFFDHVPPPVPPRGTVGEFINARTLPSAAGGVVGPLGLGFRVPMLVVSPFSKGGYVSSQLFDHTSQIQFLEQRFGIHCANISAWRRHTVGDLSGTLHLSADTQAPSLPSTASYATQAVTVQGCTPGDLNETNTSQPSYPQATVQSMPAQEAGSARRLPPTPRRLTVTIGPFAANSSSLTPALKSQVTSLAKRIGRNGDIHVLLTGYNDVAPSPTTALAISRARATAVAQFLKSEMASLGVRGVRLSVKSRGGANPIATNATAPGRARNRRVVATAS
jgi:phospholipase C